MQSVQSDQKGAGHAGTKRNVARVYFSYSEDGRVAEMRGLPLHDHLKNVALLAGQWDFDAAFGGNAGNVRSRILEVPQTSKERRDWLVEAARRHDLGKPGRFQIKPKEGKRGEFIYSFSGHRFDVEVDHPYVQQLIRLHHSFSVDDITKAQAALRLEEDLPEIASAAWSFPLDLYALEMCDQIEAEAATRVFSQPEERQRVFMEFEVYPDTDSAGDEVAGSEAGGFKRLQLFPYPFRTHEVRFAFESFVVRVPEDAPQDGDTLKCILIADGEAVWQTPREVILCPLQ